MSTTRLFYMKPNSRPSSKIFLIFGYMLVLKVCWYHRTLPQHEKAATSHSVCEKNVTAFSCCGKVLKVS